MKLADIAATSARRHFKVIALNIGKHRGTPARDEPRRAAQRTGCMYIEYSVCAR